MAGDWIKMTHALPEKPEVLEIAGRTTLNRFEVVGRLFTLWRWFDVNTVDGNARGVTKVTLNECLYGYSDDTNFVSAVIEARWLHESEGGIRVVNFDEHISESAKTRGQTAKRVAKSKSKAANAVGNAKTVTKTVPREEKRREDIPVPNGTGGNAAESTRAELWAAGKSLLAAQGMPKAQCGSFVGKLVKDHGEAVVIEAVRATVVKRPVDAAQFLVAACQTVVGNRKQSEPAWRAEQRERTQIAAPGVAIGAKPADEFFIESKVKRVTANTVG